MTCPNAGSTCNCTGACQRALAMANLVCNCNMVWGGILPPPPCPYHSAVAKVPLFVQYQLDDTQPIQLVVCEHTDSPWCPRCAGGLQ